LFLYAPAKNHTPSAFPVFFFVVVEECLLQWQNVESWDKATLANAVMQHS
jgi:hypothetical protein